MCVLMHDAKGAKELEVSDLAYADHTLLLGTCPDNLHNFMTKIGEAGMEYGLVFNWGKLEILPVRTEAVIRKPDGGTIDKTKHLIPREPVRLGWSYWVRAEPQTRHGKGRLRSVAPCMVTFEYEHQKESADI